MGNCTCSLLLILESLLQQRGTGEGARSLPSRCTNVRDTVWIGEDCLYLFQGPAGCLWKHEEDVDKHGCAEDAEDNVRLPLDVFEGGRGEVAEGKVEGPVERRRQSISLATDTQRV